MFVNQSQFCFQPPTELRITLEYYARYEAISNILDSNPDIVKCIHTDIADPLDCEQPPDASSPAQFKCASESLLRMLVCITLEDWSLREGVVRIDDSSALRQFTRIFNDPMIDFSTLCHLRGRISPETWEKVNRLLAEAAVACGQVTGERVRLDTTAVETNIHWPSDSSLLVDCYKILARLIDELRELDPFAVGARRLHLAKARRLALKIARCSRRKSAKEELLKTLYSKLIRLLQKLCRWCDEAIAAVAERLVANDYPEALLKPVIRIEHRLIHFRHLADQVIGQAHRRVIDGKQVPNDEKIFSIFEPHTELLKRGKADKPIEFGHMIQIQQVESKFITHYDVFEKKPVEHELVRPALERHKELFGEYPDALSADKGYYASREQLAGLREQVQVIAICKKGRCTEEEKRIESDPDFHLGQRFRAGVEGTISYLKRVFGLTRCHVRGWSHYAAAIGAAVFVHNLVILTRC